MLRDCVDTWADTLPPNAATVLDRMITALGIHRMAQRAAEEDRARRGLKSPRLNWQIHAAHCGIRHYWAQRHDALVQAGRSVTAEEVA